MANLTTNKDIDYILKDFNSAVDSLVTFASVNFGPGTSANRLWTNFNLDSFSRNWLELVAFVSDVFFFYFDNQATQSYLQTASVRSAIKDIAKQFGFTPATATSASGDATFTVTASGTIPRGFKVSASNGAEFYVTNNINAFGAGDVTGSVLQGKIVTEQFIAEGVQNEEFDLQGPNVIRDLDNLNPLDISPQVEVNGNEYDVVSSLIRQNGLDSPVVEDSLGNIIGGGGRAFTLEERPDGTPYLRFGDGIFGRKLSPGETITVTYRTGGGTIGNISQQTLNTLVDSLSFVSSVNNAGDFSGGADEQSIEQLRELIPASLRTLERAVAEQDYSDILVANFSEVFAASTEANTTEAGIDLNIYVVPQGNGITKITENNLLRNRLSAFIDRRKMVTVQFQILDAFSVDVLITLEVFITDTSSKTAVTNAINTALANYLSLTTGGPTESGVGFAEHILLKDISSLIQDIDGIERFEIKRLTYSPRVQHKVTGLLTEYVNSEVTVFPNVEENEWLLAAAGPETEVEDTVLFSNSTLIGFSYNSSTGLVTYTFPVDLRDVSPGDKFRDGASVDFTILGVDVDASTLIISEGQTVNNTVSTADHGSIRNGGTSYESYKVFKKILAKATNLSVDSITDNDLDLSVLIGTGSAVAARLLLDNSNVYIPGQYATGEFYLLDSAGNIWEIEENDSNTLKTSISAVNDASVTTVASGEYKIVKKLTNQQIVFQNNIFGIQYNSDNTMFSIGAQFSQIGTIGDPFAISILQNNIGNFGTALDLISYSPSTGQVRLNSSPDLTGIDSDSVLIDSAGQSFNIIAVDNSAKPSVFYDQVNRDDEIELTDSGSNSQIAQGFQVTDADIYAVVSFMLKREGNIVGNLTAKIVEDDGTGLPDLGLVVAVSEPKVVTDIPEAFTKTVFSFTTPPALPSATQFHLVLSADAGYNASFESGVNSFDNTGLVTFTYNVTSGVVEFSSAVNLSNVMPGHYFSDSAGTLFKVLGVNDTDNQIVIASGQTVDDTIPTLSSHGSVIIYDRITMGVDSSSPTYASGELARFDGSLWSNSTLGPDPSGSTQDLIFSVEGTKSIIIDSNLTPVLGPGATLAVRYYSDNNEISLILGLSKGTVTSAPDANALGRGTVASVPNRPVDSFVFRTSRYSDDIVNLRLNEIPQIDASNIALQIFGGVD